MNIKNQFSVIILLLCAVMTTPALAQDQAKIEAQIKEINERMARMMVEGNASTEYYATDVISLPNNQPMAMGIDAVKSNMEQMMASGMKVQSFTTTPVKVTINGNLVTEIGNYTIAVKMPEMSEPWKDKGKYLTLWEIQPDGSLKIKVETWNTDTMPQQ